MLEETAFFVLSLPASLDWRSRNSAETFFGVAAWPHMLVLVYGAIPSKGVTVQFSITMGGFV